VCRNLHRYIIIIIFLSFISYTPRIFINQSASRTDGGNDMTWKICLPVDGKIIIYKNFKSNCNVRHSRHQSKNLGGHCRRTEGGQMEGRLSRTRDYDGSHQRTGPMTDPITSRVFGAWVRVWLMAPIAKINWSSSTFMNSTRSWVT